MPTTTNGATLPPPPAASPLLPRALREFLHTEVAGGAVLLVATVVALVWANSPLHGAYEALWETPVTLRVGRFSLTEDVRHWVNEGLMTAFFFVVGLEIKRELVVGELRRWRTAALPALAALGGMVVPALAYLLLNPAGPESRGWGIPMATDIAFALGVVALLGPRVPSSLKVFLLTLAVVDDIGAIVVIAVFYSGELNTRALLAAAVLLAATVALRRLGVRSFAAYAVLGVAVWLAAFESGVHATLAGVVLGLLTPATAETGDSVARSWARQLADEPAPDAMRVMARIARSSLSPAERLQHELHPWTSLFVVPVFALANAGVQLDAASTADAVRSPVAAGVVLGLVLGKPVGITLFSWLAVRTRLGELPAAVGWRSLAGVAVVAGVGFTVSLFVADLAFERPDLVDAAKAGVLAASVLASVVGVLVLTFQSAKK